MDEEWTWADYPMPWCTRSEIREVSNEAQKIHDDIRHGQLLIHAHAEDSHTTVAVGTYLGSGKSVYHGEDHLRQVVDVFDSPAQALVAFEKFHSADMRPGPAPMTNAEHATAEARSPYPRSNLNPHAQNRKLSRRTRPMPATTMSSSTTSLTLTRRGKRRWLRGRSGHASADPRDGCR
ncbi:hypothetical protein ACFVRD_44520 [Streptomyces sp. NPDC057908]|uniref:hypothetical protein n=1 Tax=Streptomyces sp. NPDC057908 TaxID=3346276 RepID=UPI0036F02478